MHTQCITELGLLQTLLYPLSHTHSFFLGLPVKVEAQQRSVDFEGERQGHQATCLDLVLPQVQTQQSGTLGNEFSHSHSSYGTERNRSETTTP